jgi:hypothetical protein
VLIEVLKIVAYLIIVGLGVLFTGYMICCFTHDTFDLIIKENISVI